MADAIENVLSTFPLDFKLNFIFKLILLNEEIILYHAHVQFMI